ncbi:hypothetical protein D1614_10125 [Maribellus luteus]|uniref:Uncharacterized protein n=1 Tax=Maribellus luteus TaxID=2305463 RepID=A0A399T3V7_9BACT|nr:hypothetical protein [Maribellus luteus]RIJ48871.1 hypothetical protein D1614_10125 [Maribellus luteus]
MKVLALLFLISLSLAGVGQNADTLKTLPGIEITGFLQDFKTDSLGLPLKLKMDSLSLDEWKDPYTMRYGQKQEEQEQAMIFPGASPKQENAYDPWNMPVAKPNANNWNMPVAVPDSSVDFSLKIIGKEKYSFPQK